MLHIAFITNRISLKTFLETNRSYHAYALADLDDPYFAMCTWIAACRDDQIVSLLLAFNGLNPPALLALGEPEYLPALLSAADLPPQAMFMGLADHLPALQARYQADYLDPMIRMVLPPAQFAAPDDSEAFTITRLNPTHAGQLQTLYREAHGNAFAPYQLEQGLFYGLFHHNTIISVAGTHIISTQQKVAALGNVFTQVAFRGRGYAQYVTAAVCRELLVQGLEVVLNVEQINLPAIAVYRRLGFVDHCVFFEGMGNLIL